MRRVVGGVFAGLPCVLRQQGHQQAGKIGGAQRRGQQRADGNESPGLDDDGRSAQTRGDADQLFQAVVNLLDNALRHAQAGGDVVVSTMADADGLDRLRELHQGEGLPRVHRMIERQTIPPRDDVPLRTVTEITH